MMTKEEAKRRIIDYLEANSIYYILLNEEDKPIDVNEIDTIYFSARVVFVNRKLYHISIENWAS